MGKIIRSFRFIVLVLIIVPMAIFAARCVYWLWLCCNYEPDPTFLVATDDIRFMAGDDTVLIPKGLVLYPVNEQDEKESFYPGGHYKIYVSLEADASNLGTLGWPEGDTNLIHTLRR